MNEWVTHNEPTKDFLQGVATFWFSGAILGCALTFLFTAHAYKAENKRLDEERIRLQLEVHNREAIIGTMEETIRELRKRP